MISNSENIGKTTDEIVYMWNQEHPKDMIIFASEPEPQAIDRPVIDLCRPYPLRGQRG